MIEKSKKIGATLEKLVASCSEVLDRYEKDMLSLRLDENEIKEIRNAIEDLKADRKLIREHLATAKNNVTAPLQVSKDEEMA